jgi:methylmalonyl-CoA mutase
LTEQDPYNNIIRTTVEAMAAVLGGTQSLHTNSFDEAVGLPTPFSARLARNTQLILQEETDLTHTVDPFGGSYMMEKLTADLIAEAKKIMQEIEEEGGMVAAIASGLPKLKIEEAAARRQAKIDSGEEVIVGVNRYQSEGDDQQSFNVLEVDNTEVMTAQKTRLETLRQKRDDKLVNQHLERLKQAAAGHDNLIPIAVDAMRARATVGEVSDALRTVFGEHHATSQAVSHVYSASYHGDDAFDKARQAVAEFAAKVGRQPRILIAKLGQDGHDRGAKVIATGFADLGYDVDIGPLFQTPEEAVKQAIENDVHFIGISTQAAAHKTLVPDVARLLKKQHAEDIHIIVGGIIPPQDYEFLTQNGAAAIFGPGTPIPKAALVTLKLLDAEASR